MVKENILTSGDGEEELLGKTKRVVEYWETRCNGTLYRKTGPKIGTVLKTQSRSQIKMIKVNSK